MIASQTTTTNATAFAKNGLRVLSMWCRSLYKPKRAAGIIDPSMQIDLSGLLLHKPMVSNYGDISGSSIYSNQTKYVDDSGTTLMSYSLGYTYCNEIADLLASSAYNTIASFLQSYAGENSALPHTSGSAQFAIPIKFNKFNLDYLYGIKTQCVSPQAPEPVPAMFALCKVSKQDGTI